jgi:hypothetical protein
MATDLPVSALTKEGLERDLGKVLTVGVGRVTRKTDGPISDLELVAARLSDPKFSTLLQVEDVVRKAVERLGTTGDFGHATALVFGVHKDAAKLRTAKERREKAIAVLGVSIDTLAREETHMREALADDLLQRYDSEVEVELAVSSAESESEEQASPPLPPPAGGGRDDVDEAATNAVETDAELAGPVEPTDDAETAELVKVPGFSDLRKPHPRLLTILATTVLLLVTVAALLISGSAGSARRRPSSKNFPIVMHVESSSPGRPEFNYRLYDPNNNCDDPTNPALNYGRCGSMNGPVFDSFINTPYYGDEFSFFYKYPAATDITNDGEGIRLRVYIDNDANPNTDCIPAHGDASGICRQTDYEAIGIAHRTRVSITLPNPATIGEVLSTTASITADNVPEMVRVSAAIEADQAFSVSYVPGSAVEYNNGPFKNGVQLADSIVTPKGAPVGYSALERGFPGGFNYAATVEIEVAVHRH